VTRQGESPRALRGEVGRLAGSGRSPHLGRRPLTASIVICTRNRGEALNPLLEALESHRASIETEVIVVNNASSDETAEVVRRHVERNSGRFLVVDEPVVGLSAARNTGARVARGQWVVYLDDDAIPRAGWLDAYSRWFEETDVDSLGGPVEPIFSGALPEWLTPDLLPYLSVWDLGENTIDLRYNELPRGANVAYRHTALERVGGFDRRLGRRSRSLRSCEEIEVGLRLERTGARTLYVPGAGVRHHVDTSRLTEAWMEWRFAAQGFSEAIVDWKHGGWLRLREGAARHARDARQAEADEGPEARLARFRRAAEKAYRRGALYALWAVERWEPPPGRVRR